MRKSTNVMFHQLPNSFASLLLRFTRSSTTVLSHLPVKPALQSAFFADLATTRAVSLRPKLTALQETVSKGVTFALPCVKQARQRNSSTTASPRELPAFLFAIALTTAWTYERLPFQQVKRRFVDYASENYALCVLWHTSHSDDRDPHERKPAK